MYKKIKPSKTDLKVNTSYIGETIERKIRRILNNKEPIKDGAPLIYSERKEGVKPEFDIRTDRWEIATDKMDYVNRSELAKREARHKTPEQLEAEKKGKQLKEAENNKQKSNEDYLLKNWGTQATTND